MRAAFLLLPLLAGKKIFPYSSSDSWNVASVLMPIQRLQSTIFLRRALTWLEVRPNCRGKPRRRVNSWLRSGKAPYCHRHKNNWPLLEFYSQSKKFKYKTQTQIRKWKCLQANICMFIKHISSFLRPGLWVERRSGRNWQVLHAHQELWLQVYCHHPPSTSSLYTSVLLL